MIPTIIGVSLIIFASLCSTASGMVFAENDAKHDSSSLTLQGAAVAFMALGFVLIFSQ